ncbi:MAG: protein kinase [Planctomycetia bacterium]|nr:protein kinase [Planctomycetia bacterium]
MNYPSNQNFSEAKTELETVKSPEIPRVLPIDERTAIYLAADSRENVDWDAPTVASIDSADEKIDSPENLSENVDLQTDVYEDVTGNVYDDPYGEAYGDEEFPASSHGNGQEPPVSPPQQILGYQFERYLGNGAYGEVWIAVQLTTMRRVAVKFYTHHAQNIEFLTQEVEKLSLLFSDQNVVQLLEVGWDAETPYYIMEYLENGSLADAITRRKFTLAEAEEMFETLLQALCRAHQKGIIHCDLKPGNILMDQNGNPRLADFGQSRLSHDMTPALGTLFYMPPEQAQLKAHADVRWDVYALGAIFYTMLMGRPPHYAPALVEKIQEKESLTSRMRLYRKLLSERPVPTDFRQLKGMTPQLVQIMEKCLQPTPEERFQSTEELLGTWRSYQNRRAKFPLLILGIIMPILLMLVAGIFMIMEFRTAFMEGSAFITDSTLETGRFAAEAVAKNVESEIMRRRNAVEQMAENWQFRDLVQILSHDPEWMSYIERLRNPELQEAQQLQLRVEFSNLPERLRIQEMLQELMPRDFRLQFGDDLFFCDLHGILCARIPEEGMVGQNFLHYLKKQSEMASVRDDQIPFQTATRMTEVYLDPVTNLWSVAITTPVFSAEAEPVMLGILFMSIDIGNFVNMEETGEHFAVLVDQRPGKNQGLILEHPLYNQMAEAKQKLPETFLKPEFRVTEECIPDTPEKARNYHDPLAKSSYARGLYQERWLATCAPVNLGFSTENDGKWMVITQKSYEKSIGNIFNSIEMHFWGVYLHGVVAFFFVIPIIWYFIHRIFILKAN